MCKIQSIFLWQDKGQLELKLVTSDQYGTEKKSFSILYVIFPK